MQGIESITALNCSGVIISRPVNQTYWAYPATCQPERAFLRVSALGWAFGYQYDYSSLLCFCEAYPAILDTGAGFSLPS